ncbi:MAG: type II methionyl aminopeptidase [Candidatus Bathyarchaeia archaeon]
MSQYDDEAIEKFRLSGRILRETREIIRNFVREGMPLIEVCEKAEKTIREKGAKPAFPCNISINEIAAHYTSPPNDTRRIPRNSIVKIDIGAHVDGYVTDTAVTVCFNPEYRCLVETAEQALKEAIANIRPETTTSKIGAVIEKTIRARGFRPISNLTGHQVGRYLVHAGTSIPNISQISLVKIKLGGVYAIEPFVTFSDAAGRVENGEEVTIFRFVKSRPLKNPYARQLLKYIEENFRTLPFAERWIREAIPKEHYSHAFKELLASKALMGYPVFIEASRKPVAQAEHTVLVTEKGASILT